MPKFVSFGGYIQQDICKYIYNKTVNLTQCPYDAVFSR